MDELSGEGGAGREARAGDTFGREKTGARSQWRSWGRENILADVRKLIK